MPASSIGVALSGGGSRAIAFHLGCLRALHELGILPKVQVLSTVSGGSVIGALYALSHKPFPVFEKQVRTLLRQGLAWPTVRTTLFTSEGLRALSCWLLVGATNIVRLFTTVLAYLIFLFPRATTGAPTPFRNWHPPLRRFASRTTIFRVALDNQLFKGARLTDLNDNKPFLIINATELRTGSAFYFTTNDSGSLRLGNLATVPIPLAQAVTASAAYPLLLPALDERLPFTRRDGSLRVERVLLADGGVYDNLGLAPLWPDREPSVSLNVTSVDTIICCRAGYGLRTDPPTQFLIARLKSAFACIHDRAQNAAMQRLFDLRKSGRLRAFVLPYLGQNDAKLKELPANFVTREDTSGYSTDFYAMPYPWIDRLSRRGEQLTRALIAEHAPDLLSTNTSSATAE